MQAVESDNIKDRIKQFDREVRRVVASGYIIKTTQFADGVELFLDLRVSTTQVRQIVNYIVRSYNLDAVFFTKSHSIKVWHKNAR
jgi:hypothetical protein